MTPIPNEPSRRISNLVIVLGDQLDPRSSAFDQFDPRTDAVWMAEVAAESTHVKSHKVRIALFLSAMRHFKQALTDKGITVYYRKLDDPKNKGTLDVELDTAVQALRPSRLIVVEPGEFRVRKLLKQTAERLRLPLDIRDDRHFYITRDEFKQFVEARRSLRMEHFYHFMRRRTGLLMDGGNQGQPLGGRWNYDDQNRKAFASEGPQHHLQPEHFPPDTITRAVIRLVEERFPDHPGSLDHFDWPVTPDQAQDALRDFILNRLPLYGDYQDAMWQGFTFLYHSRISAALNLKLIDPRDVASDVEQAYHAKLAPLQAVEGFIRQVIGWREYIRGVYWLLMPKLAQSNALDAHQPLPPFYWTAKVPMNCLGQTLRQTLDTGYAHHIQRLMVTGLYSLMLGVEPREIHEWYLAIYLDAVEWAELPNVICMSQYADGGVMTSKPYIATGKYINRMSNYCKSCPYNPDLATGETACPYTTLYWDFLIRHKNRLAKNPRMVMQVKNLQRKTEEEKSAIQARARAIRANQGIPPNA